MAHLFLFCGGDNIMARTENSSDFPLFSILLSWDKTTIIYEGALKIMSKSLYD